MILPQNFHRHDRDFIYTRLRPLPYRFQKALAERYNDTYCTQQPPRFAANCELRETCEQLDNISYRLGCDDDAIVELARRYAHRCLLCRQRGYESVAKVCHAVEIEPPPVESSEDIPGAIARMVDECWWRRQLRKKHARGLEQCALALNLVSQKKGKYCSDETLSRRKSQQARNRQLLATLEAINESTGEVFSLEEIVALSVSNPKIRRAELMTRIAGFELMAKELGDAAEFYTLTCPSRMHAAHSGTGERNRKYDGTTPRESQQYLCQVWSRIRSKCKREGIAFYGFRVAEPQHDGTPHWHLLLFTQPENTGSLRAIVKHYALQTDPNEPGAQQHRFKPVKIDPAKGTATGYIAKYISKNIDGYALDQDLFGGDPVKGAERVEAWARTWGIRQFQQIGGPPVSIWRELRRIHNSPDHIHGTLLGEAHQYADAGNWCEFIKTLGGPVVSRKDLPVQLVKHQNDQPNKYGEPIGLQIKGVQHRNLVVLTRLATWTIGTKPMTPEEQYQCGGAYDTGETHDQKMQRLLGPYYQELTNTQTPSQGDSATKAAAVAPWTCVNNCTEKSSNDDKPQLPHHANRDDKGSGGEITKQHANAFKAATGNSPNPSRDSANQRCIASPSPTTNHRR